MTALCRAPAGADRPVREMLIATPAQQDDLYATHQLVWEMFAMAAQQAAGEREADQGRRPSFVYRQEGAIIQVRSADLRGPMAKLARWRDGRLCQVDLAAVKISNGIQCDVPVGDLCAWSADKLHRSGFRVRELSARATQRIGFKHDKLTGRLHRIELQVAQVTARLAMRDAPLATSAWAHGIGRGKRFGLGMLVQQ